MAKCDEIIETHEQKKERLELGIKRLALSAKGKEFTLEIIKRQLQTFQKELDNLKNFSMGEREAMSMKVEKFRKYIKGTYEKLGEVNYSNYWNLGYINCLRDEKVINPAVGAGLVGYNDRIYFVESMKPMNRRIKEKELRKMTLEKIENKIDERIKLVYKKLMPEKGCTGQTVEFLNEVHTAMAIYKELIYAIAFADERFMWREGLISIVENLEEKYYPLSKPKGVREKINEIINKNCVTPELNSIDIINELIKLRDELSD